MPSQTAFASLLDLPGRVSTNGGEPEPLWTEEGANSMEDHLFWIDVFPNGEAVLASTGDLSAPQQIVVVPFDTGEPEILLAGSTPR